MKDKELAQYFGNVFAEQLQLLFTEDEADFARRTRLAQEYAKRRLAEPASPEEKQNQKLKKNRKQIRMFDKAFAHGLKRKDGSAHEYRPHKATPGTDEFPMPNTMPHHFLANKS